MSIALGAILGVWVASVVGSALLVFGMLVLLVLISAMNGD